MKTKDVVQKPQDHAKFGMNMRDEDRQHFLAIAKMLSPSRPDLIPATDVVRFALHFTANNAR